MKLIRVSGEETEIKITSLAQIQELIGGYIEEINLPHGLLMIDEEGLWKQLPINQTASNLARKQILGDVIFFKL
jgi:hypothetical protein